MKIPQLSVGSRSSCQNCSVSLALYATSTTTLFLPLLCLLSSGDIVHDRLLKTFRQNIEDFYEPLVVSSLVRFYDIYIYMSVTCMGRLHMLVCLGL